MRDLADGLEDDRSRDAAMVYGLLDYYEAQQAVDEEKAAEKGKDESDVVEGGEGKLYSAMRDAIVVENEDYFPQGFYGDLAKSYGLSADSSELRNEVMSAGLFSVSVMIGGVVLGGLGMTLVGGVLLIVLMVLILTKKLPRHFERVAGCDVVCLETFVVCLGCCLSHG